VAYHLEDVGLGIAAVKNVLVAPHHRLYARQPIAVDRDQIHLILMALPAR